MQRKTLYIKPDWIARYTSSRGEPVGKLTVYHKQFSERDLNLIDKKDEFRLELAIEISASSIQYYQLMECKKKSKWVQFVFRVTIADSRWLLDQAEAARRKRSNQNKNEF